ncbi:MAG TPA: D-xylose ABC transporter substrate-binding protein, partial [Aurantimonas sp.]|nr:D-xylose ABC transporter substrate-binding protein [Aurantimonas sp.]
MKNLKLALAGAVFSLAVVGSAAAQEGKTVGVSWSNFQEERWKTDEAAIKEAL